MIEGILSSMLGFGAQHWNNQQVERANKAQQQHTIDMYERARRDNERQWHMQNEYNSPSSQMKRYQEAGLNPNLIYGSGGAAQNSSPMPSVSGGSYSPTPPSIDAQSMVGNYFDTRLKTAQYDNLKAQNTAILNEASLKAAQTYRTIAETDLSKFNLKKVNVYLTIRLMLLLLISTKLKYKLNSSRTMI